MTDYELILALAKMFSGSPSTWLSILLAGVVLKKYVINGTINKFLALKEREVVSLACLEASLTRVIQEQERLFSALHTSRARRSSWLSRLFGG